ncbi:MAG: DUF885 family protein [Phycisphaerales bacterium]
MHTPRPLAALALSLMLTSCVGAQPPASSAPAPGSSAEFLSASIESRPSEMAEAIGQFQADWGALSRTYRVDTSPRRRERLGALCDSWLTQLGALQTGGFSKAGRADAFLFVNYLQRQRRLLEREQARYAAIEPRLPFARMIDDLEESRRRGDAVDGERAAAALDEVRQSVDKAKAAFEADCKDQPDGTPRKVTPTVAKQVLRVVESLQWDLAEWHGFYDSYDPQFSWWTRRPFDGASDALRGMATLVREKGVGVTADNPNVIVGTPIGRDELTEELRFAMIPYTPEELLDIAQRQADWCHQELRKASADMGLGDDWKAAIERVKLAHGAPGDQPALIRRLADEAVRFVREKDLITVPALAEETWRMDMMSPDRQLVTPFFTGGEVISVAFPTEGMEHQQKVMSLKSNNQYFARATVFHELMPGHHLQQYMQSRWRTYRDPFSTPFWTEGWALYWEMLLWDQGFPRTPEERVGMLFWRMHRCARIVFSLRFHLGEWTPQQCVDYLVSEVGHEKSGAEGEVRRSVSGDYEPLYQAAYMLGGLQLRALHAELVDRGTWTNRRFHDAVMHENNIPIEAVRAILTGQDFGPGYQTSWRFDGENRP